MKDDAHEGGTTGSRSVVSSDENSCAMQACAITLFPHFFDQFLDTSLIQRAQAEHLFRFFTINPRDYSPGPHHHVDDTPYGGGAGMVMRPEPLVSAIEAAKNSLPNARVIAPSASGEIFTQRKAQEFSQLKQIIFLCGRYEGIDQRVLDYYVDEEISIGDYVVMGGEVPTTVILEASLRLIKGVIGNESSLENESHGKDGYLEAPQYTRPEEFRGHKVPDVLLSGDHQKIQDWRNSKSEELKKKRA